LFPGPKGARKRERRVRKTLKGCGREGGREGEEKGEGKKGRRGGRERGRREARTQPVYLVQVVVIIVVVKPFQTEPKDALVDISEPFQKDVLVPSHRPALAPDAHAVEEGRTGRRLGKMQGNECSVANGSMPECRSNSLGCILRKH